MNGAATTATGRSDGNVDVDGIDKLLSDAKLSQNAQAVADAVGSSTSQEVVPSHNHYYQHCPLRETTQSQQTMTNDFAVEHRIFLRAILELLTERGRHLAWQSVSNDNNSSNTIKIGYLRKASRRIKGLWKTKFVEIRKGTFSYFDANSKQRYQQHHPRISIGRKNYSDTSTQQQLVRKDITLRTSTCTCRAVSMRTILPISNNSVGGGLVFELRTSNGRRRVWMANTHEERQNWIQTIHNSMIGASVIRGDNFLQYQEVVEQQQRLSKRLSQTKKRPSLPPNIPCREFLEQYLDIRDAIHTATTKDDYCGAVSRLRDNSITVPVQWIKAQLDDDIAGSYFVENEMSSCVEQLWKDLLRDTVDINGELLSGDSFHGPGRIIGKLTQSILSSSNGATRHSDLHDNYLSNQDGRMTEAQAIAYARDILLASGRTRSGGDSYFCAENLCLNRKLVVLCPASSQVEPLSIQVVSTKFQKDGTTNDSTTRTVSGTAFTKRNSGKAWTRQRLVLSNGVLSCYAEEETEPRTLLEKVMVQGANVNISRIDTKDHSKTTKLSEPISGHIATITTSDGKIVREYLFENGSELLFWLTQLTDITVEYTNDDERFVTTSNHSRASDSNPERRTVEVVVNVSTEYKACTLDPSGIDSDDTWA